jgi:hypothetical protein
MKSLVLKRISPRAEGAPGDAWTPRENNAMTTAVHILDLSPIEVRKAEQGREPYFSIGKNGGPGG